MTPGVLSSRNSYASIVETLYSGDTSKNIFLCLSCVRRSDTDAGEIARVIVDAAYVFVVAEITRVNFFFCEPEHRFS